MAKLTGIIILTAIWHSPMLWITSNKTNWLELRITESISPRIRHPKKLKSWRELHGVVGTASPAGRAIAGAIPGRIITGTRSGEDHCATRCIGYVTVLLLPM